MKGKRLLLFAAGGALAVCICLAVVVAVAPESEEPVESTVSQVAVSSETPTATTTKALSPTPTPKTLPDTPTPGPTDTPLPTSTPEPTATPISKEDFIASVTSITYADVDRSERHVGERVCWKGRVFRIEESEDNTVFQSWYFEGRHRASGDLDAFIVFYVGLIPDVHEDSEVLVCGELGEKFEGTNVLGGTIRQPLIYALYVDPWVPAALPTATPLPRTDDFGIQKQVGSWGMKLYDVKRAKAVYLFGDAEVAQGVWLMPFVEFANLGSGTRSPWEDLDFYLQDDQGRTYEARYNDAVAGAGWQYQAGDIMDDINPGLLLGVVLPVDVPEDMGGVWLRVEQDSNFAIYLGTASAVPLEP